MIARVWHGTTRSGKDAEAYLEFVTTRVLAALPAIDGHLGAQVLHHDVEGGTEFTVITFWDSMDAIRGFAGDDTEQAVVEPEARALLISFEQRVVHHEVAWTSGPESPPAV